MIAKMRGGPRHRQTMKLQDNVILIEIPGYRKATRGEAERMRESGEQWFWEVSQRGVYSRTHHPFPDGSYAFVWLGWKDDQPLTPPV